MQSLSSFFYMNGHGFYVWCAYGMMVLLIVLESFLLHKRRQQALDRVQREARRAEQYQE